jgi:hypothetical protein
MESVDAARAFISAWNVDDDQLRLAILEGCGEPDARFVSPQGETLGLVAFNASVGEFRRAFPRASVVLGEPDYHFGFARLRWETRWNNGRPALFGDDFMAFGDDGRIRLVVSFDADPAAPA